MAEMPEGADLIDNPISLAPGYRIGNVFVLAGVPRVMQAMFDGIKHRLAGGPPVLSRSLPLFVPRARWPLGLPRCRRGTGVDIGSYPFFRHERFGTVIVARGTDADAIADAIADVRALALSLGAEIGDEAS